MNALFEFMKIDIVILLNVFHPPAKLGNFFQRIVSHERLNVHGKHHFLLEPFQFTTHKSAILCVIVQQHKRNSPLMQRKEDAYKRIKHIKLPFNYY